MAYEYLKWNEADFFLSSHIRSNPPSLFIMRRNMLLGVVMLAGKNYALFQDACTSIDSNSICLESGMCSNDLGLSCDDAYIRSSQNLLKPIDDPPIVPPPRHSAGDILISILLSRGELFIEPEDFHPSIWKRSEHVELMSALTTLTIDMYMDFPRIQYKQYVLVDLVQKARAVVASKIVDPRYRITLLYTSHFGITRTYFRAIIEYMNSLSRGNPLRGAIFANLVPFIHAWIKVHEILQLPSPFLGAEYYGILTEASRFDPLYEVNPLEKIWVIPIHIREGSTPSLLTIPVLDNGNFPLSVLDFLDVSETDFSVNSVIAQFIQKYESLIDISDCDYISEYNRATLFFMKHHPEVTPEDKRLFCRETNTYWQMMLFATAKACSHRRPDIMQTVIDLVGICGRTFFPLQFRAAYLLPLFVASTSPTYQFDLRTSPVNPLRTMSLIPINILRSNVRIAFDDGFGDPELEHAAFLSQFVANITRPEHYLPLVSRVGSEVYFSNLVEFVVTKSSLMGIGVAIGLLFRAGDPNKIFQNIPNLYLDSVSVRSGFCKVVNCVGIETLFDQSDIPTVLEFVRRRKTST